MNAKHTPGPWYYRPEDKLILQDMRGLMKLHIAQVCMQADDTEHNAHLIAAAPELLEALESFVFEFGDKCERATVVKARAAIAKAKGGE